MEKRTKNYRDIITNLDIFKGVNSTSIDNLIQSSIEKEIQPDNIIIHHGDKSDGIYILKEGLLGIYVYSDLYEKPVLVNIIRPYSIVGELSEVFDIPRGGEVTAITNSSVIKIPTHAFQKTLNENPIMYKTLCGQIYRWLLSTNERMLQNLSTSEDTIYQLLNSLEKTSEGCIEITQDQIAKLVGISRESVSKSIKKLKNKKLLKQTRGKILLLKGEEKNES